MIQRYAAHWVVNPGQPYFTKFAVAVEDGLALRMYPLVEEMPFTEWLGGMIVLSSVSRDSLQLTLPLALDVVVRELTAKEIFFPCTAWHITADDVLSGEVKTLQAL